ncbi:MAG: NmrA family protein [Bryobacterales bacterium]|nr:NmrA family protein [Bryobacterales bacterium]
MSNITTIVVAGAAGNLGGRIVKSIIKEGAAVRALVRTGTAKNKCEMLRKAGASVVEADFHDLKQIVKACAGASCVVSALAGLRDVIVDTQQILCEGSAEASVPRFIPSDFCADYTKWPQYENRTLDLRRDFSRNLDKAVIASTSILNGAFLDLLLGPFPAFNLEALTVTYWGDPDYKLEFTKLDDIAAFTALASLDASAVGTLRIVGERISARELAAVAQEVSGKRFKLIDAGSINKLSDTISRLQLAANPDDRELYPDWQLMMYMRTMFSGSAEVRPLDNDRYPNLHWTSARELLEARFAAVAR